jgi:tetratricopeptide (TPR) repeat protein
MLTLMIRKNPLDRIGLFDDRILISEDFEFKARLVASEKIAFCSPPLAKYRKHRGQKTSMPDRIKEDLEIIENLVQRYIELRPLRNLKTAWAWSMTAKILSQKGDMTGARTCLLKAIRLQPYSISPYLRMIATLPGARLLVPILRSARDMWSRNQSRVWKDTVE